ncbi:uncharacterized protein LOC108671950 [Hyalella azteca]|uniref:Uncharacterized protein LOC108671950 n=1 Tax=Hyalella azteca TaxID=294128 RepID=A0A8B7NMX8_HYAAZ|nr:uncharacterized protein LOC108671950 [Hyalella azteca]
MIPISELPQPSRAAKVQERDDELFLEGNDGHELILPHDLYDKLGNVSDPYDPNKDFIGFVDPLFGVVLVDTEKLQEHITNKTHNAQGNTVEENGLKSCSNSLTDENEHRNREEPISATNRTAEGTRSPKEAISSPSRAGTDKKEKTLHHLAYEMKIGYPPPEDENRPISGFGVKNGRILSNSSTFNSFSDEFHTEERGMSETEQVKLTALISRLHESYQKKTSSVCSLL